MRVFSPWLRGQYTRPPPQQLQPSRGATHEGPLGRPLCPAPARAAAEPAPLFALATDGRDAGFAQLVNRLARGRVEFVPPLLAPRALHWGRPAGATASGAGWGRRAGGTDQSPPSPALAGRWASLQNPVSAEACSGHWPRVSCPAPRLGTRCCLSWASGGTAAATILWACLATAAGAVEAGANAVRAPSCMIRESGAGKVRGAVAAGRAWGGAGTGGARPWAVCPVA